MDFVAATDPIRSRRWLGLVIAVAASLGACWLGLALDGVLRGFPFLLPIGAVAVVAYLCGTTGGVTTAALSGLLTLYFFVPPTRSIVPSWPAGWIGMLFYSLLAATIIVLMHTMAAARRALALGNATLESRVRERTAALEIEMADRTAAEAQVRQLQKMESLGQLTGGIAHDFNNLLTVIRGSIELLRRPGLSDERRARYIDAIGDTADRATKLTSQLLAFARRQSLVPTAFDLAESLAELEPIVRTMAGPRIDLRLDLADQHFHVMADRSQFDTAIVNMTINARDAMRGEGVLAISLGAVSGLPAIRSHPPIAGDYVAVRVADTGHGVAPEDLARIFEPFWTSKGVGEGTGLGLSQVLGFSKQTGGDIGVTSAPGEGAVFTLYLPRAEAPDEPLPRETSGAARVDGEGTCVLVVEDNPQVGEFATAALRELGYDSILAPDAESALVELEKGCDRFHIVFSDVVMPGMNGLELGQEIGRRYPGVPVILTSGYSHVLAQDTSHGFELLHKPYSMEQLSHVLRRTVGEAR